MQVHTFRAESLQAALQQVRHTLGPDASILQTRERRPGPLGLFSKRVIEVEAVLGEPVARRTTEPAAPTRPTVEKAKRERTHPDGSPESMPHQQSPASSLEPPADVMLAASDSDRPDASMPARPTVRANLPASAAQLEVQAELMASGVPAATISELLSEAERLSAPQQREDVWAIRGRIGQLVASKLKVSGSLELNRHTSQNPAVVALVGTTGVGKTTTLAKIAAGFRFDLGCRVGLIALDTFRLGGVDQLLQYAELISAPLEVVSAPEQVTPALQRLRECDVVLLDTAGRGPRDAEQLSALRKFLQLAEPQATQLVVSATSSIAYVEETLKRFQVLNPSNLLITKIDECVEFGSWLHLLQACPLPVSYLTTGQHVPQDIVVASPRRLIGLLLGTQLAQQQLQ